MISHLIRITFFSFWAGCLSAGNAEEIEFFESKIRPVLAEHCYECHNSVNKTKGDLALDYKNGLLDGGETDLGIIPGNPKESLLLKVLKHEIKDLKMPKGGPKLMPNVIADFEKWISRGAFDPRLEPPTEKQLAEETAWEKIRERRKQWWSFKPITKQTIPSSSDEGWSWHPVDKFLDSKMKEEGLKELDYSFDLDGSRIISNHSSNEISYNK